jgi:hypothetical protein
MRMCDLTITNSIIHQNYATQGAEIAINAWNGVQSPSIPPIEDPTIVTLHYNNFSDAKDHDFYIFGEPNRLTLNTYGNMNVDPLFAGNGYWDTNNTSNIINDDFWVDGDYHLKSKAGRWDPNTLNWVHDDVNSPCIDAGDPNSGLGGELWPHGKRINMGAYGGTAMASMSLSNIGDIRDLNNDNLITLDDVLLLADKWDSNDVPLKEDLDLNGIVDSNDLVFFEGNWPDDSNNIVPEFDFISDQYVDTGYELSFSVSAFDNDGDELVYMALGLPDGATFSEQLFSWIPEKPGTYTITFVASDSKSLDFMTLLIVVEENEL